MRIFPFGACLWQKYKTEIRGQADICDGPGEMSVPRFARSVVGGLCRRCQLRFRAEQAPIVPGRPDPPCALPICALCEICGLFFPRAENLPVAENHGFDGAKPYVEEAGNLDQSDICDWLGEVGVSRFARSVVVGD
jgi:hypothetical protein